MLCGYCGVRGHVSVTHDVYMQRRVRRLVRVNIECVYDDGTLSEHKLDATQALEVGLAYGASGHTGAEYFTAYQHEKEEP